MQTPVDVMAEAREWILECIDAGIYVEDTDELLERVARMTDAQVQRWVNRNWSGGWSAFLESR